MRVGLFTDTYFPQVSGVATSIRTLKTELEKLGHTVFIFTTTDKDVNRYEDWQIIRIPSVPFFAFKDRRVAYRGFSKALAIAKQYQLDIIHTQTEFSLGLLGVWIGRELRIPVIHTYHTQYEDYVRYIARGMVIRPSMVKYIVRSYMNDLDGVICPSEIVYDKFDRPEITPTETAALREKYEVAEDETLLLSLSRVSYEKNIQAVIAALPDVLKVNQKVKLIVAGDGPYLDDLKKQAAKLGISASTSETQGLTYLESIASGTPIIAHGNPYLDHVIDDPMFGKLFYEESDLAQAILEAIDEMPAIDETKWAEKIDDISAATFGRRVYEFYLDKIISKDFSNDLNPEQSRVKRMSKTIVKIPTKVIALPVNGSVKMMKASVKQVKKIRKITHFFD